MPKHKTIYHKNKDEENNVYMYYNDTWNIKLFVHADGFDEAIIGVDYKQGKYVYSIELMLEKMMQEPTNMTMEEAIEYFDFNIGCAYVGEMTPIYIWTNIEEE